MNEHVPKPGNAHPRDLRQIWAERSLLHHIHLAAEERLEVLFERHHVEEVPSLVEVNEQVEIAFRGSRALRTGTEHSQPSGAVDPRDLPDRFGFFGKESIHQRVPSRRSRYPDDIRRDRGGQRGRTRVEGPHRRTPLRKKTIPEKRN